MILDIDHDFVPLVIDAPVVEYAEREQATVSPGATDVDVNSRLTDPNVGTLGDGGVGVSAVMVTVLVLSFL